jgi:hypothetical protein
MNTVSLRIRTRCSSAIVHHNFRVGPTAICISAAIAVCRDIDIFNKYFILFTDIIVLIKKHVHISYPLFIFNCILSWLLF